MRDPVTNKPHKMCPVTSFINYTGALNEGYKFLWQTLNPAAHRRGEPVQFKAKHLGENKIASFMSDLSKDAQLSKVYTNHCIRVTGTTNLSRAHFSAHQIMSVTGHKSVNSLAMYQRVKSDEKMMMGMSLAYNLIHPEEVYDKLQQNQQQQLPLANTLPQPQASTLKPNQVKVEVHLSG